MKANKSINTSLYGMSTDQITIALHLKALNQDNKRLIENVGFLEFLAFLCEGFAVEISILSFCLFFLFLKFFCSSF